jgi:molybdopterin converting factor small subunit
MTTKVELYSALRDIAGQGELEIALPEGATVAELLEALYARFPALAAWDSRLLLAADLDYVERTHVLRPGEIVSVMPPVQGG